MAIDSHVVVGEEGTNALRKFEQTGLKQYTRHLSRNVFAPVKVLFKECEGKRTSHSSKRSMYIGNR